MRPASTAIAKKRARTKPPTHGKHPKPKPKPDKHEYPFSPGSDDTSEQGKKAFEWLLHPMQAQSFFPTHFEKSPLHLRNPPQKFRCLASIPQIKQLLSQRKLSYDEIDVTKYTNQQGKKTFNASGKAGTEAWERYTRGCTLRLRRPQSHFRALYNLCSLLESFLQCVVGANLYLTPGKSQGFAAHFDDVDAVICQIQGKKVWRVYKRKDAHDVLPRHSSVDFSEEEVRDMKLVLTVTLEEGDVLYLPRGFVHQARCDEKESLHLTVSFCQRWTWADFLLCSFERAVLETAARDVRLRRSLPLGFGKIAGVGVEGGDMRERFGRLVRGMVKKVVKHYPVDYGADMMMKRFVKGRLAVTGNKEDREIGLDSRVRVVGSAVVRLVIGDDGLPLLVTNGHDDISCLPEEAGGIKFVLDAFPDSVNVGEVPLENWEDRVDLVSGLVEMGVFEVVSQNI